MCHRGVTPQRFGMVAVRMTNSKRSDAARLCIHRDAELPDKGPSLIGIGAASIILAEKATHVLSPIPITCRILMQDPLDGEAFNTCMWLVEYQALPSVRVYDTLALARLAVTVRVSFQLRIRWIVHFNHRATSMPWILVVPPL